MIKELRGYETSKIKSMLIQLKSKLLENRFKLMQGEVSDNSVFRKTRKAIAQMFTVLKERGETLTLSDWKNYASKEDEKELKEG